MFGRVFLPAWPSANLRTRTNLPGSEPPCRVLRHRDDDAEGGTENEESDDQQTRPLRHWHTYSWSIKVEVFEARNMLVRLAGLRMAAGGPHRRPPHCGLTGQCCSPQPADFPVFGDPSSDPYVAVKIARVGQDVVSVRAGDQTAHREWSAWAPAMPPQSVCLRRRPSKRRWCWPT